MKEFDLGQLARTFDNIAKRTSDIAGSFVVGEDIDDDELKRLLLASRKFQKAATDLNGIEVTFPFYEEAVHSLSSLSNQLSFTIDLDRLVAKRWSAALVAAGDTACQFARSATTRSPKGAQIAVETMTALVGGMPAAEYDRANVTGVLIEEIGEATAGESGDSGGGGVSSSSGGGGSSKEIQTYAHIEIASSMHLGEEQTLKVGIDPERQENVLGEALTIAGDYPFDITVTVVAQEFELAPSESWSNVLHATVSKPNPSVTLHVKPTSTSLLAEVQTRTIAVLYSMNAHTLGYGAVRVEVLPAGVEARSAEPSTAQAVVTAYPRQDLAFDLTIRINAVGDGTGKLSWTFESPHFTIPPEPVTSTIGKAPEDFASGLIKDINTAQDVKQAANRINGNAVLISLAMPELFFSVWKQLNEVWKLRRKEIFPQIPTVLIVSEDAYVPWELAKVEELFDADAPPLLGAQADAGRWILSARLKVPLPPPLELDLTPMVEVSAVYNTPSAPQLKHAEEEGRQLGLDYKAIHVDATDDAIINCFGSGDPPAHTLHMALHGIYNATSPVFGLIMVDDAVLTPNEILGAPAKESPFVFLNACQVGNGKEVLGKYAGMPAAFVYARARGVVAPLWNVDDGDAKELALRFYKGLDEGKSPASLLRAERARGTNFPTSMAYLYYGNPRSRTRGPLKHVPVASAS